MTRKNFIRSAAYSLLPLVYSPQLLKFYGKKKPWFDISLAQWSLHKAIYSRKLDNLDFPLYAKAKFGINIVEYVNTCFLSDTADFRTNGRNPRYLAQLKERCEDNGVSSHLIMCDNEGDLALKSKTAREDSIDNHKKWIDAASFLECKSIRVNIRGDGTPEEMKGYATEALRKLCEIAAKSFINVLIENHGGNSSDANWLQELIRQVDQPNLGTLPDWINFCIIQNKELASGCEKSYNTYLGMKQLMPFAKGISAHSVNFDNEGNETTLNFEKLLEIVKQSGFDGIIGIEFSSKYLPEDEGILLTKRLLQKYQYS